MTILNVIGWIFLIAPFVGIFAYFVREEGWFVASAIFLAVAGVFCLFYAGIHLSGIEK